MPGCSKTFKLSQHLDYHMTTHSKGDQLKLQCTYPGCVKTFRKQWILQDHLKTHENEYKFNCSIEGCDKKYNSRSNIEIHMRKHIGSRPFKCDLCGKRFISQWNLSKHHREVKCGIESLRKYTIPKSMPNEEEAELMI